MNQQWLTILMSKGIELEQNLRQQLQTAKQGLKSQMEERGLRMNATDLAALLEEVSPKASHAALSYAMDILRPFSAGMGLRISRLSDTQIEVVLPSRAHNKSDAGALHEGALVTAAMEAAKLLWMRHAPMGSFEISVQRSESVFVKSQTDECRLRMELPETVRENVLSQLRDRREANAEAEIKIFDHNDQSVADIHLHLGFKHTPALTNPAEE